MQVLEVFQAAPELVTMLGTVEADFARFLASRRPEGPFAEVLPFAHDQAADWEAAAVADSSGAVSLEVRHFGLERLRAFRATPLLRADSEGGEAFGGLVEADISLAPSYTGGLECYLRTWKIFTHGADDTNFLAALTSQPYVGARFQWTGAALPELHCPRGLACRGGGDANLNVQILKACIELVRMGEIR